MRTRHHLFLCALALLVVSAPKARAQFGLISQKQELDAGREADAQTRQQYRLSRDRDYNGLVSHLGKRLARVCERPDIPWTFRVLESKEINAFSVPGYVYVNTGLLDAVGDDQDALAGVIAHEIGHTCGRHAVKQMEKGAIGGLLIDLLGGRSRSVHSLANVAANLVMLGYSRDDENDADRRAVRYTIRAGYDPNGLVRFFEMLERKEGSGGGGLLTYFRTHPNTGDRIKRVREEIRKEEG
jgi:predicted Zn-dependent protease